MVDDLNYALPHIEHIEWDMNYGSSKKEFYIHLWSNWIEKKDWDITKSILEDKLGNSDFRLHGTGHVGIVVPSSQILYDKFDKELESLVDSTPYTFPPGESRSEYMRKVINELNR